MQKAATVPVYSLDEAATAGRAAAEYGTAVRPVFPVAVSTSLAPDVLHEIIEQTRAGYPDADVEWLVECGDQPGLTCAMLRAGIPGLRVHGIGLPGPEARRCALDDVAQPYASVHEPLFAPTKPETKPVTGAGLPVCPRGRPL
jgi:hypothetical protein